ncbi:MAG: radical SAM protein [Candidatus Omnitrophota bacterium]
MKTHSSAHFFTSLFRKKDQYPWKGHIELTYRCNLNCIHCYCKGCEEKGKELSSEEFRNIFNQLSKEGCLSLVFSGGEPLIRNDFLEIYSYVKKKGFIITIFSNGLLFTDEILDYLEKFPPFSIEITLNAITQATYEAVTQVSGSFAKTLENIKKIKERKLPLILKANALKQNKNEIVKIKEFTEKFLGKGKDKYYFKYDPILYPRLNLDNALSNLRLSFRELTDLAKEDLDIWQEYKRNLHSSLSSLKRGRGFLYQCNSWMEEFIIDPFGRLKFCMLSDKFSVDLRTTSFKEGFYEILPQVLKQHFRTKSECRKCSLRSNCINCPAIAFLETGNEESPTPYFCQFAKAMSQERAKLNC